MVSQPAAVWTVTQLTSTIKDLLEGDKRLSDVTVAGEISNYKHHSSGHMYFTLKDQQSRIRAIMFAGRNRHLVFVPEDGMRVICRGSISVFERDGQYQLYIEDMQPDGIGALYVAFSQLKDKLTAEGLFAQERKRPLPEFPLGIGVVTSPTGAVIRDICSTLSRRYPLAKVIVAPALVQGPDAADTIVSGIKRLTALAKSGKERIDVLIVARGGGSLEELWPFNEETVARAVYACPIPIVSAVGHETDFTICDFVADVRAATPTAAAELVAPHVDELRRFLHHSLSRIQASITRRVQSSRAQLDVLHHTPLLRKPLDIVDKQRQNVDFLEGQLRQTVHRPMRFAQRSVEDLSRRLLRSGLTRRLDRARSTVAQLERSAATQVERKVHGANRDLEQILIALEALNPLRVLSRGYGLIYKKDGKTVVTSTRQLSVGEQIRIRLAEGTATARIENGEGSGNGVGEQVRLDI